MSHVLAKGTPFGARYRIDEPIGAGASGIVYRVADERDGLGRALKVLSTDAAADPESRERFLEAGRLGSRFECDELTRVFDVGIDGPTALPFVLMELLEGEGLLARIEQRGPLAPSELVSIAEGIATGLGALHDEGVIHRDVKPSNIFIVGTNGSDARARIKLLDFGLAKRIAPPRGHAATTRNHGTPAYMAPEQMRGEGRIDARADLYSVGHVVFHALVGEPYWQPELRRAPNLLRHVRAVSSPLPEPASARAARLGGRFPRGLDEWFARSTAPRETDRPASAHEQFDALAASLGAAP